MEASHRGIDLHHAYQEVCEVLQNGSQCFPIIRYNIQIGRKDWNARFDQLRRSLLEP